MTTQNLLVELFVEELPPKALNKLGAAFSNVLAEQLKAQGLAAADAVVTAFASPRRLAAHVTGVLAQGADKAVQQKLMPVAVGLDAAGNATPEATDSAKRDTSNFGPDSTDASKNIAIEITSDLEAGARVHTADAAAHKTGRHLLRAVLRFGLTADRRREDRPPRVWPRTVGGLLRCGRQALAGIHRQGGHARWRRPPF